MCAWGCILSFFYFISCSDVWGVGIVCTIKARRLIPELHTVLEPGSDLRGSDRGLGGSTSSTLPHSPTFPADADKDVLVAAGTNA